MTNNELTDRMGTAPVLKLLLKMSLPMVFSMLVSALYNIVDSIFVAQVSSEAYDAVTLVFPMQTLILAFALGIGVGTNAIVSRRLGEKNVKNASECAQTGMFLALVVSGVFMIGGYGFAYAFVRPFTIDEPEVFTLAMQYLSIVICMSFGLMIEILGEKALQATGNMRIPMITQLVGAITNIILDPILIFVCKMGVVGAAIATVTGQILGMTFILIYIARHNPGIDIFFKNFKVRACNIREIVKVGVPTLVVNAVTAFTTTILDAILKVIYPKSLTPITVLGTYFKLQSFVFMPVFGITQGAFPILGYNFGAQNKKRYLSTFKWAALLCFIIMVLGTLIFQLMPDKLMMMFNANEELLTMGTIALRKISWCFLGAAFGIIITSMFQTLGRGTSALMMSILRQVIILIPTFYMLGKFLGIDNVWWAYPIAEALTLVVFAPIAARDVHKDFEHASIKSNIESKAKAVDGIVTNSDFAVNENESNTTSPVEKVVEVASEECNQDNDSNKK